MKELVVAPMTRSQRGKRGITRWIGCVKGKWGAHCTIEQRPLINKASRAVELPPLRDSEVLVLAAPRTLSQTRRAKLASPSSVKGVSRLSSVRAYTVTPTIGSQRQDSIFKDRAFESACATPIPDSVIMAAVGSMEARL